MARGWESKSVEDEQQAFRDETAQKKSSADVLATAAAVTKRQRQALELQKERILSERTASPHRRSALAAALEDIEARLTALK